MGNFIILFATSSHLYFHFLRGLIYLFISFVIFWLADNRARRTLEWMTDGAKRRKWTSSSRWLWGKPNFIIFSWEINGKGMSNWWRSDSIHLKYVFAYFFNRVERNDSFVEFPHSLQSYSIHQNSFVFYSTAWGIMLRIGLGTEKDLSGWKIDEVYYYSLKYN